jgi:hypothetical protein
MYIAVIETVVLNYIAEDLPLLFLKQFFALNIDPTFNTIKIVYDRSYYE